MKALHLIILSLFSIIVSSCKKDTRVNPYVPTLPVEIAAVRDSVTYTLDGKTFMANKPGKESYQGNYFANKKLVPNANGKDMDIVYDKDSVLYFTSKNIYLDSLYFTISFVKKFASTPNAQGDPTLYIPYIDFMLPIINVGKHTYTEDFERNNSQNGIAIKISANSTNYTSYGPLPYTMTSSLKPGFQKDMTFEIISLVQATSGGYNLEARFSAYVYDRQENRKSLEKGYLRLHIN